MKNFIFLFIATFVASFGMAQNTETTVDTIGTPHHFGVYVGGHIYNPNIDTIWMDVTRSLDGVNFTDTVAVDTLLDGQGVAIPFDLVAPLVPSVTNWIRVGTYTGYSSSVSYDTIIVLAPDTPQTVTLTGFQQIAETGNSVTAVLSWEGGDTLSTVFIENGPTTAYANAVINFQITGSGSDTVTIPASGPNAFVYTRTHVETPGFSWSNQLTRVFQAGSTIPASISINVDTSFNSSFGVLVTVNVTVGDCDSLTVTPTLYQSNGNAQLLQDSIFAADGVWTFPISGLSSSIAYSLEVAGTGNCAAVTEVATFVSPEQNFLEILSVTTTAIGSDSLVSTATFDSGDLPSGMILANVLDNLGTSLELFPGIVYSGAGTRTIAKGNLVPGATYMVRWTYIDTSGTVPPVYHTDTLIMQNVPCPTGAFIGQMSSGTGSFAQDVQVNPGGSWAGSATTMHYALYDQTTVPEVLVDQSSTGVLTTASMQTISYEDLQAGGTYRLEVWLENDACVQPLGDLYPTIEEATNPNLFLQLFDEISGNKVRSKVHLEANGNEIELKYDIFVNGSLFESFDTIVGSSTNDAIWKDFGPFDNCDQVQIQVVGIVTNELFNPAVPQNNLQETIEINCIPLPSGMAESIWDGLVITSQMVVLPSGVSQAQLQIVSMKSGQIVLEEKFSGSLNFSLESGVYVCRLTTEGHVTTRKIATL
ncbi:MAG: T9SS type A sorting domain-containing protein [Candidatus Pacebacteria bacterium]|nr:T9SS type A sorting domain-containing protein [Candidatus Paceibacterota bacterium]